MVLCVIKHSGTIFMCDSVSNFVSYSPQFLKREHKR